MNVNQRRSYQKEGFDLHEMPGDLDDNDNDSDDPRSQHGVERQNSGMFSVVSTISSLLGFPQRGGKARGGWLFARTGCDMMVLLTSPQSIGAARTVMSDPGPLVWVVKLVGALAGSLISLAYILPRGRREAMLRLSVGIFSGLLFGTTAGLKIADFLGLLGRVSLVEITLVGAAASSLCAWWALGVLHRLSERGDGLVRDLARADARPSHHTDKENRS